MDGESFIDEGGNHDVGVKRRVSYRLKKSIGRAASSVAEAVTNMTDVAYEDEMRNTMRLASKQNKPKAEEIFSQVTEKNAAEEEISISSDTKEEEDSNNLSNKALMERTFGKQLSEAYFDLFEKEGVEPFSYLELNDFWLEEIGVTRIHDRLLILKKTDEKREKKNGRLAGRGRL
eukprot:Lithocolla_globosa_v1_NODE_949_length_3049_cov_4.792251.p2 type:complete len:175 gc:universal NODE_949_length_3049_cov_4.792251:652-128(-)